MSSVPTVPLRCANQTLDNPCALQGSSVCSRCKLVSYCGPACQRLHWSTHKVKCNSPLNKASWMPDWDRNNRAPAWASGEAATNFHNPFGSNKYLWGNTPAMDIARIPENEGLGYDKDMSFLFAASGDLRSVIRTIRSLPESLGQNFKITINDWDFDVAARSAIMLLFAFASLDENESEHASYAHAAESLIHLWYSAFIPHSLFCSVQTKVGKLLHDDTTHTVQVVHDQMIKKTWSFPRDKTLCITLRADQWPKLDGFLEIPAGLTEQSAREVRAAVVMSPERADYRDRWYFKDAYPSMRVAKQQFRDDGILLPFGHPRAEFTVPNPTMFQSPDCWPFDDQANPMGGWSITDVYKTPWPTHRDEYGKLFAYLREEFETFFHRLTTLRVHLQLLNVDANVLPKLLTSKSYDRIEVSNISDAGYMGTHRTLSLFAPLLQHKTQNVHATMITCYLNAVMETMKMAEAYTFPEFDFLERLMPQGCDQAKMMRNGAEFYKVWDCRTLALDSDRFFNMYMEIEDFEGAARDAGVTMKKKNTVVESWPCRMKAKLGDPGAQEEFDLLLSSTSTGVEHYVEWLSGE
ncbi:hypothetical protein BDW02DRAFT_531923 [Decorospora gaudefroyi]|uniref:MYND-type domain-containing protein n=1 Tax=Decorospora gaudefroyi TaxID=184978 RepID=A0A6A5K512_9PLEO|nr:hypothetical protein BDW02DRAFT_531923 [Decorospora gaudefroyi]